MGAALWYHTPVVITLALAAIYLFSQTAWRLRGKRGWVLRYDRRWPMVLVGLFLANCVVRNVLWLGLGAVSYTHLDVYKRQEQISIDPGISEWGNPAGQYPVILR